MTTGTVEMVTSSLIGLLPYRDPTVEVHATNAVASHQLGAGHREPRVLGRRDGAHGS